MAVPDNVPGRSERIELTVQRELARRRRFLYLYVLLLLVPIGVGVWFVFSGYSVTSIEQKYQRKIDQVQEMTKFLPKVQSAAQQVDAQKAQVDQLARGQEKLRQQLTQVASGVEKLAPQIQQIQARSMIVPENAEVHRGLDVRLNALERNVNELRQTQTGLAEQQKRIVVNLEQLQKEKPFSSAVDLEKLNARLMALEKSHEQIKGQVYKLRPMEKPPH